MCIRTIPFYTWLDRENERERESFINLKVNELPGHTAFPHTHTHTHATISYNQFLCSYLWYNHINTVKMN